MINVLVTGAGGGVGQGVIKSLKLIHDLEIRIVAADMSANSAGLYTADKAYLVDRCDSDGYLESLASIFSKESIDYYIPGTDVELLFCAENKQYIKDKYGVNVVVSSVETIQIADDKYKTVQFLKENDLAYPDTQELASLNVTSVNYPVIVKPKVGCRSIGVYKVTSENELKVHLSQPEGIIAQEYIGGDDQEYTCTVCVSNGIVSPVLVLKRTLRSGDTFRAEPIASPVIESYVKSIAEKLDIEGGCNFQLRVDNDGVPKLFEINSRFSGTTPFCSQLNFNPVEFYLKKQLGINIDVNINYDVVLMRYWSEAIISKEDREILTKEGVLEPTLNNNFSMF